MKTFNTFLTEGVNDHFLYHGTDKKGLEIITVSDLLEARTKHPTRRFHVTTTDVNKKHAHPLPDAYFNPYIYRGISLSRDARFSAEFVKDNGFTPYILKFDARKLRQRFKILPVDYNDGWRDASKHSAAASISNVGKLYMQTEREEFLLGPIPNVSKYLVEIMVQGPNAYDTVAAIYKDHNLPAPPITINTRIFK